MPAKKATKKAAKKVSKVKSWDEIGAHIGKKIENDYGNGEKCGSWCKPWPPTHEKHGHCFGALLFGIILVVILNQQDILLDGVAWWLQVLLVAGWTFMWS